MIGSRRRALKVTQRKTTQVEEEEVVEVICDWCKKPFEKNFVECFGYGTIEISFGYPSDFDGKDFEGEICDDCFREKIMPHLREREDGG